MKQALKRIYRNVFPKYGIRSPIVVHQMAKVGSTSVYRALQQRELNVPIHHTHVLSYFDELEAGHRAQMTDPTDSLHVIDNGRRVFQQFQEWRDGPWHFVSLVRDPVARNVSQYFYAVHQWIPDFDEQVAQGRLDLDEIRTRFLEHSWSRDPSDWFDIQVRDPFGIDVYATPFPKHQGYAITEGARVRMLILRLEDLEARAAEAFWRFLRIPNFSPVKENVSTKAVYRQFTREITLPESYLDDVYGGRLARHFYTDDEIQAFKARWMNKQDGDRMALAGGRAAGSSADHP